MSEELTIFEAGVYMIRSLKSGVAYIGASCDLTKRPTHHFCGILRGNHPNRRIRRAFRNQSVNDFEIRILERMTVCDTDWSRPDGEEIYHRHAREMRHLFERERFWIQKLQPSCNVQKRKSRLPREGLVPA